MTDKETIEMYEKCFVKIAKAHNFTSRWILVGLSKPGESYAETLARHIEETHKEENEQAIS